MGRTTPEYQDKLRVQLEEKLIDERDNKIQMRVFCTLKGKLKENFINDVLRKEVSVNKHVNDIMKFYYEHNPSPLKY